MLNKNFIIIPQLFFLPIIINPKIQLKHHKMTNSCHLQFIMYYADIITLLNPYIYSLRCIINCYFKKKKIRLIKIK